VVEADEVGRIRESERCRNEERLMGRLVRAESWGGSL